MKSPIFIVGPHRSGSTLWHNLVVMSPNILRLTETRFLTRVGQRDFDYFLKNQVNSLATDEDVDNLVTICFSRKGAPGLEAAFWRFEGIEVADNIEMRKKISERIKGSKRTLGEVARIILEEVTHFSGYARACIKFPLDVGHIPELFKWFPDCKVMHITRDPRALSISKSNDPSGTAKVIQKHPRFAGLIRKKVLLLQILQYRWAAKLHSDYRNNPNYRLFRYEDLLAQPEQTLINLCDFIEVEFYDEMLSPEKGNHKHQPSSNTGKQQKAFDPKAAIRWKNIISPLDNWLITNLTRGSMKRMDYNPKIHPIFLIK